MAKEIDFMEGLDPLKGVNKEKLKEWLLEGDGHTIFTPDFFTEELGFGNSFIKPFIMRHGENATSFKSTVFNRDGKTGPIKGVYGLTVLGWLAGLYDVHSDKLGRGFRAAELGRGLIEKLKL
jgi:hypothetical protein